MADYEMKVAPYDKNQPIYYEFTACPVAEFAKKHGLEAIMPALCNVDYASMELIHTRLIRTSTCADGCKCDYTICGDRDEYAKAHPEYRDAAALSGIMTLFIRQQGREAGGKRCYLRQSAIRECRRCCSFTPLA